MPPILNLLQSPGQQPCLGSIVARSGGPRRRREEPPSNFPGSLDGRSFVSQHQRQTGVDEGESRRDVVRSQRIHGFGPGGPRRHIARGLPGCIFSP